MASLTVSGWAGSSGGAAPATAAAKTRKLKTAAQRMDVEVPHRFGEKAASVTGRPQPQKFIMSQFKPSVDQQS